MRKRLLFEEDPKDIHLFARHHKKYFENLPEIGDLYFYKSGIIYDGEPLIYICKDKRNKLYFCQFIDFKETLIFPISRWDVFKLFTNISSIRSLYYKSNKIYYINAQEDLIKVKYKEIEKLLLEEDFYLDYFK